MLYVFGPNDTYFFDDGYGNRKWRAGPDLNAYMASTQVGKITSAALGADGAFFLNYMNANGLQHMNAWEDPGSNYPALYSWLFLESVPHDRESVYVSMGMRGSFFAASSQGHRWRNIPESLQDYYQKFTRVDLFLESRVKNVDLGVNETYLSIGVDNTWSWDLGDEYPELSKLLGRRGINDCVSPVMFSVRETCPDCRMG